MDVPKSLLNIYVGNNEIEPKGVTTCPGTCKTKFCRNPQERRLPEKVPTTSSYGQNDTKI